MALIEKKIPKDIPLLGIGFACLAFMMFSAMGMFNKLVAGHHHVIEVSFYRNIVAFTPYLLFVLITQKIDLLKTDQPYLLGGRAVLGTLTLFLTLGATQYLPLADATTLFFVSTLLVPLFASFFLKEHIGWHRIGAIIVGLSGVILVAQPSGEVTLIGTALALGAGVGHATIQTMLRALRHQKTVTINFYFFLTGLFISGAFMPFIAQTPSLHHLLLMCCVGVSGLMGQFFLTNAFRYAPAVVVSPFNYTGLLWSGLFDVLIWQVWPGLNVWLGALIIMSASFYIIYREVIRHGQLKRGTPIKVG